ncbi:unnamed protein product [Urochloa decumbens]|uniref:PGG domain-containing protein n=1 Tax=Urochloa decumbens TaxID=240449 RepID=A0ABC9ANG3_9POAL
MAGMDPELYKAATHGKVKILKQLLQDKDKSDILLWSTTPQRNTALHLAALHGHAEFAREVLQKNGELLVARNGDGDTPLHLAAREDKMKVAELLVGLAKAWQEDPNGNAKTPSESPLMMTNKAGNTPLHEATKQSSSAMALLLLNADPNRGHDLNGLKESPLHVAARKGLEDVVRKILETPWVEEEYKPSVSVRGTALYQAMLGRKIRIVQILLEKRPALTDLTDSDGNNALHYAAQEDYHQAVELLLNHRTELAYECNNQKQTPLQVAAHYGSTAAIRALLRHCPDVAEMTDAAGYNAFHTAVVSGKTNALRCLLRVVRPAVVINSVDTPLHLATKMSHFHSALALLSDRRVDPSVRDRDGKTARSIVEMKLNTGELDAYEMHLLKQLKQQEAKWRRKQQLPPMASDRRRPLNNKDFDSVVDSYFLAATLIATVTFAATFTMPGGYDQTRGIALHAWNAAFKTFVVSNTVAMCSSIVVIFLLIWARQEHVKLRLHNLMWSQTLTIIACLAMLLSLMTAVYITVAPTASWPAYAVIAIGASSPALFFFICWLGR